MKIQPVDENEYKLRNVWPKSEVPLHNREMRGYEKPEDR
jgi:hypothetical protein